MPKQLGPYSHAVRAGEFLFIAGKAGLDPSTGSVPAGGFEAEARQAFTNLRTVVEAAGASLGRVVKTTVFLSSAEDFPAMNPAVWRVLPGRSARPLNADRRATAWAADLHRGDRLPGLRR